jgi:Protein of Unknown function (DUF2784)
MDPQTLSRLADAVLLCHVGIVLFNVFGLVAIPLGAWRRWSFVRIFWWRAVHLGILAIVALQAVVQRACFLTIWQSDLMRAAGTAASDAPLLQRWLGQLLYWRLPPWVFAVLYVAICAYTLLLWILVPPRRRFDLTTV